MKPSTGLSIIKTALDGMSESDGISLTAHIKSVGLHDFETGTERRDKCRRKFVRLAIALPDLP